MRPGRTRAHARTPPLDAGYLDAEELGVIFKSMSMPMGQNTLDDIVDEIDVDGNGV